MGSRNEIIYLTGLYVGYFQRAPDPEGLKFWLEELAKGRKSNTVAQDFSESAEAQDIYPYLKHFAESSLLDFLSSVYQNFFNRLPDAAGLSFWSGQLELGTVTVGDMIEAIMKGAEGQDAAIAYNKIEAAYYWTKAVRRKSGFTYNDDAARAAKAAIADITAARDSVKAAKIRTDVFVANPLWNPYPYPVSGSGRPKRMH